MEISPFSIGNYTSSFMVRFPAIRYVYRSVELLSKPKSLKAKTDFLPHIFS